MDLRLSVFPEVSVSCKRKLFFPFCWLEAHKLLSETRHEFGGKLRVQNSEFQGGVCDVETCVIRRPQRSESFLRQFSCYITTVFTASLFSDILVAVISIYRHF